MALAGRDVDKPRPFRVFHVLTNLDIGGAQTSVALIALGLRRSGIDARIVSSGCGGRESLRSQRLIRILGDACVPMVDIPAMRRDIVPLLDFSAFLAMRALFLREKPDAVHTHMTKAGLLGRLAARSAGVPIVVHSARGWAFQDSLNRVRRELYAFAERALARRTDRIVAVSGSMIEEGLEFKVGSRDRYQVIRTGIDPDYFESCESHGNLELRKQLGIPATAGVVGTVMGLTSKKSPHEFLEVCRVVLDAMDDSRVVVVGDGELRLEFEKAIRQMGLGEKTLLVGLKEDVRPFLGLFDVFLLTSRWEGLPRVLLEAVCAGVPIVSTDAGGIPELLPFVPDLAMAKTGSTEQLSRLVLEKLSLKGDRSRARATLPEEFHIEHVVREHVRLYSLLASEKGLSCKPPAG